MDSNKIALNLSTIILITAAAFMTRSRILFNNSPNMYYTDGGSGVVHCKAIRIATATVDFTTGGAGSQANINTANGSIKKLWATSACTLPVHFHPIL